MKVAWKNPVVTKLEMMVIPHGDPMAIVAQKEMMIPREVSEAYPSLGIEQQVGHES